MIDVPVKNQHDLCFRTGDVTALGKLLDALRGITPHLRINFTPQGLFLSEFAADGNILIFCRFKAQDFTKYECNGPGFFATSAQMFWKVLSGHNQKDEIQLKYVPGLIHEKTNTEYVTIDIIKQGGFCTSYCVAVYTLASKEMTESQVEHMDYAAIVSLNVFYNFTHSVISEELEGLNGKIEMYVGMNHVMIEMHKDASSKVSRSRLNLLTVAGSQLKLNISVLTKRTIAPDMVKKECWAKHMQEVIKFLELSTSEASIMFYIKKDEYNEKPYPLILEVGVGSIGIVRLHFMPCVEAY